MELSSEQVHWIYGAVLVALSIIVLLHRRGAIKRSWPEFLFGAALLVFGLGLILDPYLHGAAAPGNYAAETAQHLILGIVLVLGSGFELYRARMRRGTFWWRLPLALALVAASLTFLLHAQHAADVSMLLLVTQHRFIGATLLLLALAVLIAPAPDSRSQAVAVPLLTLLLGLQFLIYTEGNSLFGVPSEEHGSVHAAD